MLTGCGEWIDIETVEAVVWSDDDEEVAYAIQKWESFPGGYEEVRNYRFEIRFAEPNRSDDRLGFENGGEIYGLYYMRAAGYVFVSWNAEDDGYSYERYSVFDLDGNETEAYHYDGPDSGFVEHGCYVEWAVPSPTGVYLALQGACERPYGYSPIPAFGILRAEDASLVGFFRLPEGINHSPDEGLWTPEGSWVVPLDNDNAYFWNETDSLTEGPAPDCGPYPNWSPPTTSSPVSSNGTKLCTGKTRKNPFSTCGTDTPFGC